MALALLLAAAVQNQVPDRPVMNPPRTYIMPIDANAFADIQFVIRRSAYYVDFECASRCLGKKHISHPQCDDSCDSPCEVRHPKELRGRATRNRWLDLTLETNLKRFGVDPGVGVGIRASMVDKFDRMIGDETRFVLPIGDRHWSEPCSTVAKVARQARIALYADIKLMRATLRPDGTTSMVQGPSCQMEVGVLFAPVDWMPNKKTVQCECALFPEYEPDEACEEHGGVYLDPDLNDGKEEQQYCNGSLQQQVDLVCTVESMTECTFTATNKTDKPVEVCIYAGTELISADDRYQNMGTMESGRILLEAASAGPALPTTGSVKVRVACLNMNKREPGSSVKFRIGGPLHQPLRHVARFGAKERFKTVLEQMRVWLMTDQATLADMQKHLMFPKPSAGQFLRALETVASVGGEDLTEARYRKCLEPGLIAGAASTTEAVDHFVELIEQVNSAGLARLASQPATFAELWTEGAGPSGVAHAGRIASSLGNSRSPALREAAVAFLVSCVPEGKRGEVATANGLVGVCSWLLQPDETWARKALEVVRTYRSPASAIFLLNANEGLPEELRTECKALAGELSNPKPPSSALENLLRCRSGR